MLNQVVLVGRLADIKENEKGISIILCVPEPYKNVLGIYENNFFEIKLYEHIAERTKEYCEKGDIIGIKGRIRKLNKEENISIVAEKVTLLTTKRKEDEE